jgi:hypothetical protein
MPVGGPVLSKQSRGMPLAARDEGAADAGDLGVGGDRGGALDGQHAPHVGLGARALLDARRVLDGDVLLAEELDGHDLCFHVIAAIDAQGHIATLMTTPHGDAPPFGLDAGPREVVAHAGGLQREDLALSQ